jgi:hypothetical protein
MSRVGRVIVVSGDQMILILYLGVHSIYRETELLLEDTMTPEEHHDFSILQKLPAQSGR